MLPLRKKSIHEALVGSQGQTPKSLESPTKHKELDVMWRAEKKYMNVSGPGSVFRPAPLFTGEVVASGRSLVSGCTTRRGRHVCMA